MSDRTRLWAVVPAAGKGARMQSEIPKQYLPLRGKPVIQHTLEVLSGHPDIHGIAVALAADDEDFALVKESLPNGSIHVVDGGAERCHSVAAGIAKLREYADDDDWVLVHDAARPCLRAEDIDKMIAELENTGGGILAVPVRDTLKRCDQQHVIEGTVDRTRLWHALTPQMFKIGDLADALEAAIEHNEIVTDEAQAMERAGGRPVVVEGHADNIKITHPTDLELAALFLEAQGRG